VAIRARAGFRADDIARTEDCGRPSRAADAQPALGRRADIPRRVCSRAAGGRDERSTLRLRFIVMRIDTTLSRAYPRSCVRLDAPKVPVEVEAVKGAEP